MEGKQLNFNRPLLSVRRGSSTTAPSEVNKRKTNNSHSSLPPLPFYKSELKSGPVRNPGVVPFQWEQTPGRPKDENNEQRETLEHLPLAPKLPPGRVVNHKQTPTDKVPYKNDSPVSSSRFQAENNIPCSPESSSIDKVLPELEGSVEEKADEGGSTSDDENVTYVDARDTLSRTESFFLNCSVSGVSGLDDSNMEPSGPFSDPLTRDFMMGRFLPAAKAVVTETPHFASRKHPVAREQPKPVKNVVTWKKQSPRYYDIPNILPNNIHNEGEEEEEEDVVDEFDGTEDLSAKFCGLLPRFCLMNPIPGMKDHTQAISSVRSVRTRSAYAGVRSKIENKDKTDNPRGELKSITCQYGSPNKSSLNGHFRHNGTEICKNGSPQSFLGRERGFRGPAEEPRDFRSGKLDLHKKGYTKFKELLADHSDEEIASPVNPAIEKTLYVESDQRVESRNSNSSSSGSRGRTPSVDISLQDIKSLCGADENASSRLKSSNTVESSVLSSEKSSQDAREKTAKDLQKHLVVSQVADIQQPAKPDVKATQKSSPPLPVVPLLLKSPSESWLSRTLPSMPLKNPSSKSYLGNVAFRPSPVDPRRDGMLKTLEGQRMLFRPVGELAPILEK